MKDHHFSLSLFPWQKMIHDEKEIAHHLWICREPLQHRWPQVCENIIVECSDLQHSTGQECCWELQNILMKSLGSNCMILIFFIYLIWWWDTKLNVLFSMCKTNTGINSASMQYCSSLLFRNNFNGEIGSVLKNKTKQRFRNYQCQSLTHLISY